MKDGLSDHERVVRGEADLMEARVRQVDAETALIRKKVNERWQVAFAFFSGAGGGLVIGLLLGV